MLCFFLDPELITHMGCFPRRPSHGVKMGRAAVLGGSVEVGSPSRDGGVQGMGGCLP